MVKRRISRSSKAIIIFALLLAVDAHSQSWEAIAPMFQARYDSKCVELKNGLILVAGGQDNTEALSECELYNPITNQWTVTGSLNQARFRHSLIALNDGRALAIGGLIDLNIGTTASCELYDPATGTWTFTDSLSEPSEINSALKLPDGKVFIAGGADANIDYYLDFAFLFDPTTNTLTRLPDMGYARTGLVIYCNPSEDTLMACGGNWGGLNGYYFRTTVVYTFAKNQWTLADSSVEPHDNGQTLAIEMPDNKPLLVSGRTGPNTLTQNIEAFDWSTGAWSHVGQVFRAQWHCYAFRVGNDSIVLVGGSTPDYQNVTKHTTWYQYSNGNSWAGADMIEARFLYTGLLYDVSPTQCSDSEYIYVFGGADTNTIALASCEKLAVKAITSSGPATLSIPSAPQSITELGCSTVDTSVLLGISGCGVTTGTLDSIWLSGSPAFRITDVRAAPRTLAALDSIVISYLGTSISDTAELHIRYDLGSGMLDTIVTVIGSLTSPLLAEPEQIHREAAGAYYGGTDTLPLAIDVSASTNLDSLWPYLTDIQATYTWDSSVASYTTYLAPSGWSLSSLTGLGDSVDFEIHKTNASVTQPLGLGTALFQPNSEQLATTWVELPRLVMKVGGKNISLCVTDNEDNHWAVKTLGVLSGVAASPLPLSLLGEGFYLYPNPAEDELFVRNSGDAQAAITIYDAIGRIVGTGSADAESTATLDTHALSSGVYFVRIVCRGVGSSKVFVKNG